MYNIPQTSYTADPVAGIVGSLALGTTYQDCVPRVNTQTGRPRIWTLTFAGTWAPADDADTTIAGVQVVTTLAAGEDTIEEARDAHLVDLQANANLGKLVSFAAQGTDEIVVSSVELAEGTGKYLDFSRAATESTAGNGTLTGADTQTPLDSENMPLGVGVALDQTDSRGKRVTLPTATAFKFGGIVVHSHAVENKMLKLGSGLYYPVGFPFSCIMNGYVRVKVDTTVQAGDTIYVRHTPSGLLKAGGISNSATGSDAIPGSFHTGASAGGIAIAKVAAP